MLMSPSIRLDGETQVVDSRVSRKRKSMVLSCCLITWEHLAILFSRCIFFFTIYALMSTRTPSVNPLHLVFLSHWWMMTSRWRVWREDRQCPTRRRRIWNDFHRPRQRWDVGNIIYVLYFVSIVCFFFLLPCIVIYHSDHWYNLLTKQ